MTCAEFQKVLPYIIETGGNAEEERHLRECPICADLVQDLRYIAEQAKLLVPMEDPSPRVWEGIRDGLQREGLVKPARARGRLLGSYGAYPWVAAIAAVLLVVLGITFYRRGQNQQPVRGENVVTVPADTTLSVDNAVNEEQDRQILTHVSNTRPAAVASTYEAQMKQVNASIADARRTLQQFPDDDDARQSLMKAYQQKAMMYEMATRSLQ